MQTHEIKRNTKNKTHTQVGRGGNRGKQSGRGGKGQTARAGNKRRPALRDIIKKLPKLRGYRFNPVTADRAPVNLGDLQTAFKAGETVNPTILIEKGLVKKAGGRIPRVKILGGGELTHKLTVSGCLVSESAKAAIEKAGGTIEA